MQFIGYKKCSTCNKAFKTLQSKYPQLVFSDYTIDVLSKSEIQRLHEKSKLDIKTFFNTSGLVYKEKKLKDTLENYTLKQKYELLAQNPTLIKRPIFEMDDEVIVGNRHCIYKDEA